MIKLDAGRRQNSAIAVPDDHTQTPRTIICLEGSIYIDLDPSLGGSIPTHSLCLVLDRIGIQAVSRIKDLLFTFCVDHRLLGVACLSKICLKEHSWAGDSGISFVMNNVIPQEPSPPKQKEDSCSHDVF